MDVFRRGRFGRKPKGAVRLARGTRPSLPHGLYLQLALASLDRDQVYRVPHALRQKELLVPQLVGVGVLAGVELVQHEGNPPEVRGLDGDLSTALLAVAVFPLDVADVAVGYEDTLERLRQVLGHRRDKPASDLDADVDPRVAAVPHALRRPYQQRLFGVCRCLRLFGNAISP